LNKQYLSANIRKIIFFFGIYNRSKQVVLKEGEFFIVPKGIEHMPYAPQEAHILLFEPKEVINTGDASSEKKVANPEWI